MTPVKNGVLLYLPQHGSLHRTDLYDVGNCWLFRVSPGDQVKNPWCHFSVFITEKMFWREGQNMVDKYGTLVAPKSLCHLMNRWED